MKKILIFAFASFFLMQQAEISNAEKTKDNRITNYMLNYMAQPEFALPTKIKFWSLKANIECKDFSNLDVKNIHVVADGKVRFGKNPEHPQYGRWAVYFESTFCGQNHSFFMAFQANDGKLPQVIRAHYGTTFADWTLQNDTLQYIEDYLQKEYKDKCFSNNITFSIVADDSKVNEGEWVEIWGIKTCLDQYVVNILYKRSDEVGYDIYMKFQNSLEAHEARKKRQSQ